MAENKEIATQLENALAKIAELEGQLEEYQSASESGKKLIKVPGTLNVVFETPAGETVKKKVRFANGHAKVMLNGVKYPSAAVMQLANKGKVEDKYAAAIGDLTKEQSVELLTHLVKIESSVLVSA